MIDEVENLEKLIKLVDNLAEKVTAMKFAGKGRVMRNPIKFVISTNKTVLEDILVDLRAENYDDIPVKVKAAEAALNALLHQVGFVERLSNGLSWTLESKRKA